MVTRQYGQFGWVVILERAGEGPVPFGVFDTCDDAMAWAASGEFHVREGETYSVNYVRDVAPPEEDAAVVHGR